MKKLFLILVSMLVVFPVMASEDVPSSKIIIYREPAFQGSLVAYNVFINDILCTQLKNNSYYEYDCAPGKYVVRLGNHPNATVNLEVEDGRNYYLRFGLDIGFWEATPELILVDDSFGAQSLERLNMNLEETISASYVTPKNRIGINLGGGFGFNSALDLPIVYDYGKEGTSTLRFGGGFSIGAEYGHEFTKYFDLAVGLDYRLSQMSPMINKMTFNFSRGVVSATPSIIIPIGKIENKHIRIGAGLDVYFANTLNISDKDGAFDYLHDTWHYKSTLGYHVQGIFDVRISDMFSYNFALRLYNVDFKFDTSNMMYPYDDSKLYTPNGAGIDVSTGFFYHF